jgi:peptidoglycan/LPS O-acetylase OafA/YrhL
MAGRPVTETQTLKGYYAYADVFVIGAAVARLHLAGRLWSVPPWITAVSAVLILVGVARLWGPLVFPPYSQIAALPYALLPGAGALVLIATITPAGCAALLSSAPLRAIGAFSTAFI